MKFIELLYEKSTNWQGNPKIGWWLDNDPVTFYHGTHKKNIPFILENGIIAPKEGPTAGWVSLALEPNTAIGYASMSGIGGETQFRAAGKKAVHTPLEDRVVFVLKIPQDYFLPKMAEQRGAMKTERNKLKDKEQYEKWQGSDQEYYALTEIRLPELAPVKFIQNYMFKR